MADRCIYMMIHGAYGAGKTTLAHTVPGPRIILDTEGGSYDVGIPLEVWDKESKDTPYVRWAIGEEEAPDLTTLPPNVSVIVDITSWDVWRQAFDFLREGKHGYRSVVVDSITELQRQLKEQIRGDLSLHNYQKTTYDTWDQLQVFLENDLRRLRDLTRPSAKTPVNAILVASTNVEERPMRPILQGGMRRTLPGFLDIQAFLRVEFWTDPESGNESERWVLDLSPGNMSQAEVKCRPRAVKAKYGTEMWDPTIRKILREINPRPIERKKKEEF